MPDGCNGQEEKRPVSQLSVPTYQTVSAGIKKDLSSRAISLVLEVGKFVWKRDSVKQGARMDPEEVDIAVLTAATCVLSATS